MAGNLTTVKAFNCFSCGSTLQIRAEGQSQVVVCSSCKSILDISNPDVTTILSKFKHKRLRKMVIPLGTRGKIHGGLWEVIGYMERSDGGTYAWSEYLLFNPMKGFRWLSENNGHWSYVLMTKEKPKADGTMAAYGGHFYSLFHQGSARIEYVEGEFYWRAKVGDRVSVKDFVRDNEMLSMEATSDETIWSVSEYIHADDIATAFKVQEMPTQFGVAPNQPCPMSEKIRSVTKSWVFFLLAMFAIQFISVLTARGRLIHQERFTVQAPPVSGQMTSQTFEVDDQMANIQVGLTAPVDNSWFFIGGELVNVNAEDSDEFDVGVEYYHGYDDGYWSEGSQSARRNIPAVTGGTYQLNFEAQSERYPMDFELTVYRDVPLWKPFIWCAIFLSLWPLFLMWRRRSFNVQKWQDSDYSPYQTEEDDDDE